MTKDAAVYRTLRAMVALLAPFVCSQPLLGDLVVNTERVITKLAEGIYEIRHPDAPDGFPQGNTTVVIGGRGVLVVDSGLLPSSTREDIEQIRKWTGQRPICGGVPVRPSGCSGRDPTADS